MTDNWALQTEEAWNEAAYQLEQDGYTRQPDDYYPAVFVKGDEKLVLVRDLGFLNWHTRRLDE